MATLGQPGIDAHPIIPGKGKSSWNEAKAFWFDAFGYKVYAPEVRAYHESDAALRIVSAPARSSKSHSAGHDALVYGMPTDPLCSSLHWSIGPTYDTNREFQEWWRVLVEQQFQANGQKYKLRKRVNNPSNGAMEIQVEWGRALDGSIAVATFKGMSATNQETLQGEEVTTCTLSEAGELPETIYTKYVESRTWKTTFPTTPKQKAQWIKDLIDQGREDPKASIEHFEYTGRANPRYNWERYGQAKAKATMRAKSQIGPRATASDDPYFAEQFLGHWVWYTGAVLPFRRATHVVTPNRVSIQAARICVSVDYGYEDPAVALFWAILPGGVYVIFDEIYEKHLSSEAFVTKIQDKLEDQVLKLDYACGDPSRPEVERIMRDAGLEVFEIDKNAQRDREAGHRHLVDTMIEGPTQGYPGLYVTTKCTATITEWESLHYREGFRNEYGATALVGNDHAFDAARYFVQTRPDQLPEEKPINDLEKWQAERKAEKLRSTGNVLRDQLMANSAVRSQEQHRSSVLRGSMGYRNGG